MKNELEQKVPVIQVGNVKCKISNIENRVAEYLSKELSAKVPNYWYSYGFQNGFWDGTQKFFVRPANVFPTGLLERVVKILIEDFEITPELIDKRSGNDYSLSEVSSEYYISENKKARDYQVDTLNKIINKEICGLKFYRGIVNIATNGGKTSVAISLIKELYEKLLKNDEVFLFVTHSKEIARQAKDAIENDLNIPVGFVGDGVWEVKNVTVAIITTLNRRIKKPEFLELKDRVIGFVADECHHSQAVTWYDTFCLLDKAFIRIGLTGTVTQKNPVNEMRLYACSGEVISRVSNEFLISQGFSAKPVCMMFMINSPDLEELPYQEAYSLGIVENKERLLNIYKICEKETKSNFVVLILVERVEHGELILDFINDLPQKRVEFINGTLSSEKRQEILEDLKDGNIDVLISTSVLDEGVDVSGINAIIYARGMTSSRKLLQGIGRGLRKKSDGSKLRFYDFIDNTNTTLLEHSLNRYNTLENENFTIKSLDIQTYMSSTWEDIESEEK